MIDNKTTRLLLPLPHADNYLEDDVARLQDALTIIDTKVAIINDSGKLSAEQIPDEVALLDAEGRLSQEQIPSDVARLDDNGELLLSQVPTPVVVTDENGKIPASVVPASIARSGNNSDITALSGLTSPITAPQAMQDNQLATLKQVNDKNASINEFHSIKSAEQAPAAGTLVRGGEVFSDYKVADANYVQAIFRAKATIGGAAGAEIVIRDDRSGSVVDTVLNINNGAAADVGYALVDFGVMGVQTRKVVANPFGNNTPVFTVVEFQSAAGVWAEPGWILTSADNSGRGMKGGAVLGEGLVIITGNGAISGTNKFQIGDLHPDSAAPATAPTRMHVWKLNI